MEIRKPVIKKRGKNKRRKKTKLEKGNKIKQTYFTERLKI